MIRHPQASPLAPWYVALFAVDLGDPESAVKPGMVAGSERAQDALQFAREIDANLYRRAHLSPEIGWVIERIAPRAAPPAWSEASPDLLLDGLREELAAESLRP